MATDDQPADWQRLGKLLIQTRLTAGWNKRIKFAFHSGLTHDRIMSDLENAKRSNYDAVTLMDYERIYGWAPGSFDSVLHGGNPTPLMASAAPASAAEPADATEWPIGLDRDDLGALKGAFAVLASQYRPLVEELRAAQARAAREAEAVSAASEKLVRVSNQMEQIYTRIQQVSPISADQEIQDAQVSYRQQQESDEDADRSAPKTTAGNEPATVHNLPRSFNMERDAAASGVPTPDEQ